MIVGWFLIVISFFATITLNKAILSYQKIFLPAGAVPGFANPALHLAINSAIIFLAFFLPGVGILRRKRWGYHSALCLAFLWCWGILKMGLFFGPRSVMRPDVFISAGVSVAMVSYLLRKDVIELFYPGYSAPGGSLLVKPRRVLWRLTFIVIAITAFLAALWLLLDSRLRQLRPDMDLLPHKVGYTLGDKDFLGSCEKREVFGYSVSVPAAWELGAVLRNDSGAGWAVVFVAPADGVFRGNVVVESPGGGLTGPISAALNFRDPYEFERALNYSRHIPFYTAFKALTRPNGLRSIDDASTMAWKGFVQVRGEGTKEIYDGSLYGAGSEEACNVSVLVRDGTVTREQVRSIFASLIFSSERMDSARIFERAKRALAEGHFTAAGLDFSTALYLSRKPEYAYYLARALFENVHAAGRRSRLRAAKDFLDYAVQLDSGYAAAKELLVAVNAEIGK